jgi:hypothetical protein
MLVISVVALVRFVSRNREQLGGWRNVLLPFRGYESEARDIIINILHRNMR